MILRRSQSSGEVAYGDDFWNTAKQPLNVNIYPESLGFKKQHFGTRFHT